MASGTPDASFVLDIAATMPAGEATIGELDALTAELMGAGKGAEVFGEALKKVGSQLDHARAFSQAANLALAEGSAEYRALEQAANKVAIAAERAAKKNAGVIPFELARAAADAAVALDDQARALKRLEAEAKRATGTEAKLVAQMGNVKKLSGHVDKSFSANAEKLGKVQAALGAVGGPLGMVGGRLVGLTKGFGEMSGAVGGANTAMLLGAAGAAVLAAAAVALSAAVVFGAVKLASWGVELASAAKAVGLTRQAVEAMNPALAQLHGTIDAVGRSTGTGAVEVSDFAKSLLDAKVSAADMPAALEAAAMAEKALGKGGSAEFVAQIKKGSVAVGKLAADTKAKLGGIVAAQLGGIDEQAIRIKKNFASVFDGLDIAPIERVYAMVADFFDTTQANGAALKLLFNTIFQPFIDWAEKAYVAAEAFVLGFLIGVTELYIKIKPAVRAIAELFGFDDPSSTDMLAKMGELGETVGMVLGVVAIQAIALAGVLVHMATGFAAVLGVVGTVIGFLWDLGGIFVDLGLNMMKGLALGITDGAGAMWDAMKNAVMGAVKKAKALLGIHSPSTVFAEIGDNTGEGFAQGIEGSTPAAQRAIEDMVAAPPPTALEAMPPTGSGAGGGAPSASAAGASSARAGGGGGRSIDLSGAQIGPFYGVKDAEQAAGMFEAALLRVLEGTSATLGSEAA